MNLSKIFISACMMALINSVSASDKLPEYKDKSVTGVNRLDSRSTFWYYTSREDALKSSYLYHPENVSLNGKWYFSFCEKPADRIVDFYKDDYDPSGFDLIDVPGSWPLQGYDKALYMNHPYEFNIKDPYPARVPDDWNPVGSYRRDFEVPMEWKAQRVVLHFGAVKSSYYVWVNGQKVGYSQDSKMQAEFDITPYLRFGKTNNISVEVYRFSIGSYLEGQDMWRLAGIKRDVWIYATPNSYVKDIAVNASLINDYTEGQLDLRVDIAGKNAAKGSVEVELVSPNGESIFTQTIKASKVGSYTLTKQIGECLAWSDEKPDLYTLLVSYNDGKQASYQAVKVGFRTVELKNSQLLVNGAAIRIKGVNRHEHHPKYGHYIPTQTMELDVEVMKQLNINAVRTSHYPSDPYFYELCDKYGIFICDEANVETHGLGATLQAYYDPEKHISDDASWQDIYHDRMQRMYNRDKNHPSVIIWSMGNECADGSIFRNGYKMLKEMDPSRLVIFEQAGMQSHTDIVGPMYATIDKIKNYALAPDTYRPLILCEYSHAMGNSMGNFADYWEFFDSYPNLQGGFVWDWVDQGIEFERDGERYFDYGGAFGLEHTRNDGAFCLNGVVNPDRVPNPHAYELKKVYDNVDVSRSRNGVELFNIRNKNAFTNLSEFDCSWSLTKNGEIIEKGTLDLDIEPNKEKLCSVDFETKIDDNDEYLITFEFSLPEDKSTLKAGCVVASEQLALSYKKTFDYQIGEGGALSLQQTDSQVIVEGDNFVYAINKATGRISSINYGGQEFLKADAQYDFYRVPVDNDSWDKEAKYWKQAHERTSLIDIEVSGEGLENGDYNSVSIAAKSYVDADHEQRLDANFTTTYTINVDGSIEVDNKFIPVSYHAETGPTMPRLGERYQLRGDLSNAEWYGRGPWENYADRKTAAFVANYSMPVEQLTHEYIRPQENGYRTDTRELVLSSDEGLELKVIAGTLFSFNASYYPKENYFEHGKPIRNTVDLKAEQDIYLNVDFGQKGVGGDNSWGRPVHEEYRILLRAYNYNYTIKPSVK